MKLAKKEFWTEWTEWTEWFKDKKYHPSTEGMSVLLHLCRHPPTHKGRCIICNKRIYRPSIYVKKNWSLGLPELMKRNDN